MLRTRLIAVAALTAFALPGCGIFCGDRKGVCERMRERREERHNGAAYGMPVSFPGGGEAGCGGSVIPPGAMIVPGSGGLGAETMPPPLAGEGTPRIPSPKIKENPGKQFELEKGTRGGPILTIPASGVRGE